jgi:hypothetical protein
MLRQPPEMKSDLFLYSFSLTRREHISNNQSTEIPFLLKYQEMCSEKLKYYGRLAARNSVYSTVAFLN